ncbi:lysoplasmalogenase [Novosphingobium sp. Gsoil 351]|uniref:lysoplasmalogenase n=1 Tax=Novosphingobium sp. Gsoil 351 TaxID=2675225 RepID=UPI0012B44F3D|nr:lysoplasmalogenase [Novosphingobium sp. Gsoil 351]QGN53364.1 lysoplasmalogenase [Novosphingobium sp. Gsoil 351]
MPKRALIERRPWLLASLVAGVSFYFVKDAALAGLFKTLWKGAGVAFLAIYAARHAPGRDGKMLSAIMVFGAAGDMAIEIDLVAGAACFFVGHVIAIALYTRHRRASLTSSQQAAAVTLLLGTPLIAFLLPTDRTAAPGVALYAFALGGMAAAAWSSAFPRYRVGLGAVLFVASDLLIFSRMGPLATSALPDVLIWPLYYLGQFLICVGAVGFLRGREA